MRWKVEIARPVSVRRKELKAPRRKQGRPPGELGNLRRLSRDRCRSSPTCPVRPKKILPRLESSRQSPRVPQAAEDARFKAEEAARKATEGKPKSDAEVREEAERAGANLAHERARSQALEQQLAREDEQKLLAQERARSQALEQQLAAREDEQKLLAQERARSQALEQQLAVRRMKQKLLAQERARSQALEQQLAARADEQKLLAQERARSQALEQQLAARADEQKLLAQERARSQALEQQLAARADEQKLLARERARSQALEQQLRRPARTSRNC